MRETSCVRHPPREIARDILRERHVFRESEERERSCERERERERERESLLERERERGIAIRVFFSE